VLEIVRKGEALTFKQWTDLFLENNSKPPLRAPKTYETHLRAVTHLVKVFGDHKLTDLTSDAIEGYLRYRLRQRARWKTKGGIIEKGVLKPSTVHQELRVLRRMLNIAVRKKLLPSNPCWGVEFPVAVKGLFRPHYVSWSEQQRIRIYDLRSTYATRLSAGGVADEWVTQLLRQGDAKVFKKYSQMKLQMKREALQKLNRAANESAGVLGQAG